MELEIRLRNKACVLGIWAKFKQTSPNKTQNQLSPELHWSTGTRLLKENLTPLWMKVTSSRVSTIFNYNVWHLIKNYKAVYENKQLMTNQEKKKINKNKPSFDLYTYRYFIIKTFMKIEGRLEMSIEGQNPFKIPNHKF